jgi:hypothetical protein
MPLSLDLSLTSLAEVGRRGGFRDFQQDDLVLGWTPLRAFDSYVVNLFAPAGHALWNFNVYAALFDAELAHSRKLLTGESRGKTQREIGRIIQEAGHAKRSDFAARFLGMWTATPDHFPPRAQSDVRFLAHRHRSVLVPAEARNCVTEHFFEQGRTFVDSSVKPCDDAIALSEVEDLKVRPEWRLLSESVNQINSQKALDYLLDMVGDLADERRFQEFVKALDIRFGIQGHISLWLPPTALVSHLHVEGCAALLEFRLKVALSICTLPQQERLMKEAESLAGSAPALLGEIGIRQRSALRDRLQPYLPLTAFRF